MRRVLHIFTVFSILSVFSSCKSFEISDSYNGTQLVLVNDTSLDCNLQWRIDDGLNGRKAFENETSVLSGETYMEEVRSFDYTQYFSNTIRFFFSNGYVFEVQNITIENSNVVIWWECLPKTEHISSPSPGILTQIRYYLSDVLPYAKPQD
ncbi:MAG: hypothetical protein J5695_02925 [Bacteroidales bacterium]|nr:hypothetical protein [Bacteroidales bacterium]